MTLRERADKLKLYIPALFLALKRRDTPWYAKALAGLTVAYALSPIDLIPDFIPVLGYIDDLIILPALAAAAVKLIPRAVMDDCLAKSEGMFKNGKPVRWYYALPIAVFWAFIVLLIVKSIF